MSAMRTAARRRRQAKLDVRYNPRKRNKNMRKMLAKARKNPRRSVGYAKKKG